MLLTTGGDNGRETILRLEHATQGLEIWTQRSLRMPEATRTLKLASVLRGQLREGDEDPVILLMTHPWFGAEDEIPPVRRLRGLFVQYPGQHVRPALAAHCERWVGVDSNETSHLASRLGDLLG